MFVSNLKLRKDESPYKSKPTEIFNQQEKQAEKIRLIVTKW